ncbi:MAG: hypothetical protein ACRDKG_15055 [Actinomycetota bacterium]
MRTSRRKLAVVAGGLAVVAFAGAAFAYFTNSGSGSGTASVGSSSEIALSSPLVGDLYPDGADVPVTVTISNAAGQGAQFVDTVSGSVADNGDCLGSWFEVDDIVYQDTIAAGGSDTAGTNVRMNDSGTNQDECQGDTLTINWTSN